MKVAYLVTYAEPIGGALIHVRDLAVMLSKRGHEVIVLAGGEGTLFEQLREKRIQCRSIKHLVRPIKPLEDLRAILEIRRVLKELKPDLVTLHSSKAGFIGRLASFALPISVVFTAHGWAFTEGVPARQALLYKWLEKITAPLADRIITVSEYDRQLALNNKVSSAGKMITIHNGVHDIDSGLRARVKTQPPRLIMIARCLVQKDHPTLLQALSHLKEFEWTLDLVGGGPLQPKLEEMAVDFGISDRIRFLGTRSDVAECVAQSQIFLLISNYEGFPLSTLEAMRAGLPVVVSDVGGAKEAIIEGETGFLIPRGDVEALRVCLKRLLVDPDLRVRLGAAGRRHYEKYYTMEHLLEQTVKVYCKALRKSASL